MVSEIKTCNQCGEEKVLELFERRKLKSGEYSHRGTCISCCNLRRKKWKQDHREIHNQRGRDWYERNREKKLAANKAYNKNNPAVLHAAYKRIIQDAGKKAQRVEKANKWASENRGLLRSYTAAYRARKIRATPIWADFRAIGSFYEKCPNGFHVDHIVPLNGRDVCGLHTIENLQYLPKIENLSKGNRHDRLAIEKMGMEYIAGNRPAWECNPGGRP